MCRWLPVLFVAVGLGWVERKDEDVEDEEEEELIEERAAMSKSVSPS